MSTAAAIVLTVGAAIASFAIPPHRLLRRARVVPQPAERAICPVDEVIR